MMTSSQLIDKIDKLHDTLISQIWDKASPETPLNTPLEDRLPSTNLQNPEKAAPPKITKTQS
jgi:hypothetical protein